MGEQQSIAQQPARGRQSFLLHAAPDGACRSCGSQLAINMALLTELASQDNLGESGRLIYGQHLFTNLHDERYVFKPLEEN